MRNSYHIAFPVLNGYDVLYTVGETDAGVSVDF
jgi:hypothetical protein